jgi:hypothetical protein
MEALAMGNAAVDMFVKERAETVGLIESTTRLALEQHRDLTPDDFKSIDAWKERIGQLDRQLALIGDVPYEIDPDTRSKLERVTSGAVWSETPKYRTAGELLWDTIHANMGSAHSVEDQEARKRYERLMRAAQHMGTDSAITAATAGDLGGLFVNPIVGPIINISPQGRPFLSAIGVQPAPNSLTFVRPRIVDPDFATGVAVQSTQKSELASKKFDVAIDNLTLATVGGYLNVSQQLLSFQAGALNIILGQMQRRLGYAAEVAAITEVDATTEAATTLAANADAKAVLASVFEAAATVYENSGELPSWIAMGPGGWRRLGSLVDSANRPMFPYLGAVNGLGTMTADSFAMVGPAGLRPIVTRAITDFDLFVGGASSFEAYEYSFPVLEAVEPSLLGRQIAVASALAFYRPTTVEHVTGPPEVLQSAGGIVEIPWTA